MIDREAVRIVLQRFQRGELTLHKAMVRIPRISYKDLQPILRAFKAKKLKIYDAITEIERYERFF